MNKICDNRNSAYNAIIARHSSRQATIQMLLNQIIQPEQARLNDI